MRAFLLAIIAFALVGSFASGASAGRYRAIAVIGAPVLLVAGDTAVELDPAHRYSWSRIVYQGVDMTEGHGSANGTVLKVGGPETWTGSGHENSTLLSFHVDVDGVPEATGPGTIHAGAVLEARRVERLLGAVVESSLTVKDGSVVENIAITSELGVRHSVVYTSLGTRKASMRLLRFLDVSGVELYSEVLLGDSHGVDAPLGTAVVRHEDPATGWGVTTQVSLPLDYHTFVWDLAAGSKLYMDCIRCGSGTVPWTESLRVEMSFP